MKLAILLFLFITFIGCSNSVSNIQRVDAKSIHITTIHWSSEDLHMMAEAMVVSILKSKILEGSSKKVFSFSKIKNSTYDHIDTKSIAQSIKTSLIKSGRVLIVEVYNRDIDALFFGDISAIYQKNSISKDMFFKFTLNLVDAKNAKIIWSEEKEVRKIHKKAYLGW